MRRQKNSKVSVKLKIDKVSSGGVEKVHQSSSICRQARVLGKCLKYGGYVAVIYQCFTLFQNVDGLKSALCNSGIEKRHFHNWLYNNIMPNIFEERSWLCRITGWDCFDEMIRTNATLTNIMNEWWTNKKEGNFLPWLKDFNPSAFEYFCSNNREVFPSDVNQLCSSVLRFFNVDFARNNCPNGQNLKINKPAFSKSQRFLDQGCCG